MPRQTPAQLTPPPAPPARPHLLPRPPPASSGRFLRPAWDGYRVLVTKAGSGERCWVNLAHEGAPTFLRDYRCGRWLGLGPVGRLAMARCQQC